MPRRRDGVKREDHTGTKYIRNCYAKLYTTMTAFSPSGKGHSYNYACEYKYRKRDYVCKYSDGDVNHTQTSLAGISRDIYVCNVNMLRIFFSTKPLSHAKRHARYLRYALQNAVLQIKRRYGDVAIFPSAKNTVLM